MILTRAKVQYYGIVFVLANALETYTVVTRNIIFHQPKNVNERYSHNLMVLRTIVRNFQQNGCRVRIHCYFCALGLYLKARSINK